MRDVIFACVRSGTADGFECVRRLRDMIWRHAKQPYGLVCLTDQPERCEGVEFIDITGAGLPSRWAKMLFFEPTWRGRSRIVALDLGVSIVGDLSPLQAVPGELAICEKYDASVMVIGGGMAGFVWDGFDKQSATLMVEHARVETIIAWLYPDAPFLQRLMPKGFFKHSVILRPLR